MITYILFLFTIYAVGVLVGMYLNQCKREHVDAEVKRVDEIIKGVEEAPTFAEAYKARTVKRPSTEKLVDKNKPKRVKEAEKAMEEILDRVV